MQRSLNDQLKITDEFVTSSVTREKSVIEWLRGVAEARRIVIHIGTCMCMYGVCVIGVVVVMYNYVIATMMTRIHTK